MPVTLRLQPNSIIGRSAIPHIAEGVCPIRDKAFPTKARLLWGTLISIYPGEVNSPCVQGFRLPAKRHYSAAFSASTISVFSQESDSSESISSGICVWQFLQTGCGRRLNRCINYLIPCWIRGKTCRVACISEDFVLPLLRCAIMCCKRWFRSSVG